jgi:hypothetical protein
VQPRHRPCCSSIWSIERRDFFQNRIFFGPATQAFVIDRYKGELAQREMLDPAPRPGDVVVAIQATSVNPLDAKIRDGEFKFILHCRLPLILGNDFAGTVVAVGAGARRFKVGDEVYARPDKDRIGTFADRVTVSENDLATKTCQSRYERGRLASPRRAHRVAGAGTSVRK